mmetsp:Transcript_6416/g.15215  ORF Transcript_6416/g.15215 Transcript_6416/m.15215 type:complete len:283 (-) Transcript_6416:194-1042(-)
MRHCALKRVEGRRKVDRTTALSKPMQLLLEAITNFLLIQSPLLLLVSLMPLLLRRRNSRRIGRNLAILIQHVLHKHHLAMLTNVVVQCAKHVVVSDCGRIPHKHHVLPRSGHSNIQATVIRQEPNDTTLVGPHQRDEHRICLLSLEGINGVHAKPVKMQFLGLGILGKLCAHALHLLVVGSDYCDVLGFNTTFCQHLGIVDQEASLSGVDLGLVYSQALRSGAAAAELHVVGAVLAIACQAACVHKEQGRPHGLQRLPHEICFRSLMQLKNPVHHRLCGLEP